MWRQTPQQKIQNAGCTSPGLPGSPAAVPPLKGALYTSAAVKIYWLKCGTIPLIFGIVAASCMGDGED